MPTNIQLIKDHQADVLAAWLGKITQAASRLTTVSTADERDRLSRAILDELLRGLEHSEHGNIESASFDRLRQTLSQLSADFAERGLTPSETATYVFSLKEVLFDLFRRQLSGEQLVDATWRISQVIDQMGLFTFETFSLARERIIKSQAQALTELSTPVIQVWEGVIALPLVGSIDSMRAKEIMEKLLDAVVAQSADVVIIDITGVPVVDTQVANRLMRTVEAVRLLGTSSIITGINPVIAQTLVQLGVDLSQLTTKASLRSGLQQAFRDMRLKVVKGAEAKR
jgi:rsbT co-antagonist protein RsbR